MTFVREICLSLDIPSNNHETHVDEIERLDAQERGWSEWKEESSSELRCRRIKEFCSAPSNPTGGAKPSKAKRHPAWSRISSIPQQWNRASTTPKKQWMRWHHKISNLGLLGSVGPGRCWCSVILPAILFFIFETQSHFSHKKLIRKNMTEEMCRTNGLFMMVLQTQLTFMWTL